MRQLDLNLVRAFVAIYETRSVTQAAERLALTQPTVSYALARLREAYADRLFLRGKEGLVPTTLAEHLFERLSVSLAGIDGTFEERIRFDPGQSTRRFRLAMSDIGVLYFAAPLLRRFQETAPQIEIELLALSDSTGEDLVAGRLDVAVGNLSALLHSTQSAALFREHYVCLMSADHPVIGERMSLKEFIAGRHVMVASPFSGHRVIDQALAERNVSRRIVARVPHFTVLPQLLAQSDLLVILPSRVAGLYVAQGGLKMLPLPVRIPEFEVRVHWHVGRDASAAHRWLVQEIVETVGRL
ncbi:MAG TPA: LysR family transcriptional regulator [Burkholderiaceae bacterium]|jgi:DNA-binding transcriptional LysR family regulator